MSIFLSSVLEKALAAIIAGIVLRLIDKEAKRLNEKNRNDDSPKS